MRKDINPLSPDQIQRFIETANQLGVGSRLAGCIPLFTGVKPDELIHLRKSWLHTRGPIGDVIDQADDLVIEVKESSCSGTMKVTREAGATRTLPLVETSSPCPSCAPDTNWEPLGEHRKRRIPVIGEPAVETITWWFKYHDGIPFRQANAVTQRVKRIGREAEISDPVTSQTLRDTYGTMLVKMGYSPEKTREYLGYKKRFQVKVMFDHVGKQMTEHKQRQLSNKELKSELKRLHRALNRPPTKSEMVSRGNHSPFVYQDRFGSWNDALRAAGFEPPHTDTGPVSSEELLEDLRRLTVELGHPPSTTEIRDKSRYSNPTYRRHFDGVPEARDLANLEELY